MTQMSWVAAFLSHEPGFICNSAVYRVLKNYTFPSTDPPQADIPLFPPLPQKGVSPRHTGERSRPFSPAPALPLHQAPFPSRRSSGFLASRRGKRRSVSPEFAHSNDRFGPGLARRELSGHTQSASWEGRPSPPARCPRGRAGQARRSPAAKAAYPRRPSARSRSGGRAGLRGRKAALTHWEPPRTLSRRMSAVPTRPPSVRA